MSATLAKTLFTEALPQTPRQRRSTGLVGLDILLGGGWHPGKLVMVSGKERSGKSTIAYYTAAATQHEGGLAVWITARPRSFVRHYALNCGLLIEPLVLIETETIEAAIDAAERVIQYAKPACVVLEEMTRAMRSSELLEFGTRERTLDRECARRLGAAAHIAGTTVLVTLDDSMGTKAHPFWIAQHLATVGRGTRRMDVFAKRAPDGHLGMGLPLPLIPEHGVDLMLHRLSLWLRANLLEERHGVYYDGDHYLGRGRQAAAQSLASAPERCAELDAALWHVPATDILATPRDLAP